MATSVKFKGNDLEQAPDGPGWPATGNGTDTAEPTGTGSAKGRTGAATAGARLATAADGHTEEKVATNKAAIVAANKRFGQLGDYNILDEVTVYFANGKVTIDPKYKPQLQQLAEKAVTITAYMIQVKGYASSVGNATLNQKLSEDRANNVTQFLQQQAHIPLTNMLAPGAMGESRQVGSDKTAEGQAENRRVVVRILQNKGIAGT